MPDFLKSAFASDQAIAPLDVLWRLVAAMVLGTAVAWIYRQTHKASEPGGSFPTTLVLLAILIAMVTQVIGDNVARAFSLVGALSIVRFRTVVRDTEDTAYVIFAVAVGMAVGAHDLWVALLGIAVIALTAFWRRFRPAATFRTQSAFLLDLRVGLGNDLEQLLAPVLDAHVQERELLAVETARQGMALDVTYHTLLRRGATADALVLALNRLEGVQSAQLRSRSLEPD